jgi:hypothetical protein
MTTSSSPRPLHRFAIVSFDWLPAWTLSTWGATWVATPAFDRLAARGVTLDAVMAPGDDAAATLQAVFADMCRRRGREGLAQSVLVTDSESLACGPLAAGFGQVVVEPAGATRLCVAEEEDASLWHLFAAAADAEAAVGRPGGLLWCHAGSLGVAWDAPLEFRDSLVDEDDPEPPRLAEIPFARLEADADPDLILGVRQAFAGQVMLADRMLGRLLDVLAEDREPWTVVVLGLRGMPLGLHGQLGFPPPAQQGGGAGLLPYADLVQMPVIVADAAGRMAGQRYGGLLTAEDVGAFLCGELAGGGPSRLGQLLENWECLPRSQAVSQTAQGKTLVTDEWRLVVEHPRDSSEETSLEPPPVRLFAKPDDFFEQCDVADRCPGVVEDLLTQI